MLYVVQRLRYARLAPGTRTSKPGSFKDSDEMEHTEPALGAHQQDSKRWHRLQHAKRRRWQDGERNEVDEQFALARGEGAHARPFAEVSASKLTLLISD